MKRYKIRHYRSRIYNPIRGKIIKGILIGVIVLAVFGIGWFAYEPLMEAINDRNEEIVAQEEVPEKPQEQAYEPVPEEFLEKETLAVTVPEEALYNSLDYYDFLKALDKNVTAVVIDMKTAEGTVTYNSKQISVINAGAMAEKPMELDSRVKTAKKLGLDVVLRIYAFEDSTAPYNAVDMAIRYESEEGMIWLDESVDNGGKPWLNPYSDTAQKYIFDIVYDAIDFDADAIIIEGMRFPEKGDMSYAYFGVGAEGVTREEVLTQFIKRIYSGAAVTDTNIIIGYDSYLSYTQQDIYGTSPLNFSADGFAPFIDFNDFVGERINDDFYFRELPEDMTELFTAVYGSLGDVSAFDILPVISCEGFAKSQFTNLWSFLAEKGTKGYILVYDEPYFTGIPAEPLPEETEENPAVPETPVTPPVQQETPTEPTEPTDPTDPAETEGQGEEAEPGTSSIVNGEVVNGSGLDD